MILWASSLQAQWPQFRGPNAATARSGILDTTELAVTFGPIENVRWEAVVQSTFVPPEDGYGGHIDYTGLILRADAKLKGEY